MELPVYIDGKEEGVLRVEQKGTYTIMTADLRDVGRVVRLTLYGEHAAGYLGVPEPANGRQHLTRRFSPLDMARMPQEPKYAADRPLEKPAALLPPPPEVTHKSRPPKPVEPKQHILWMGGKPYFF